MRTRRGFSSPRVPSPFACVLLVLLLAMAGSAWATEAAGDELARARQHLEQTERTLASVRRSLDDADAPETLRMLSEQALQAQRDADAAVRVLEPELAQLDARLAQLGPAADAGGEARDIGRQRAALEAQRSQIDADAKRGRLRAVEARQLAEAIEKMRAQRFGEQLGRKLGSPLSPALWQAFAQHLPDDLARIRALGRQAGNGLREAVAGHGWTAPLLGLVLAVTLLWPLRLWLRWLGRRHATSVRAPEGRLRRTGLATWLLAVGTLLPGVAAWALVESLRAIGAIPPRLETVATALVGANFVAAFIASLAASLLVPNKPSWRLLAVDDATAARLCRFARAAAALTWLTLLLRALVRAARTSQVGMVMLDGLVALAYVALIMALLVTFTRLHRRRALEAEVVACDAAPGATLELPQQARSGWLVVARLGGYLTVLAALLATVLGYLNFALFVAQQMVWMTVVVLALSLLVRFAGDLSMWLLAPDGSMGRTLRLSTGLPPARLEQAAVLLAAVLRVALVLLGVAAVLSPFGNLGLLHGGVETLAGGVRIGDKMLRPASVFWALVVLALGLGLMKLVQQWLTDTYLPRTSLDVGARNSIAMVARYLGVVLAVLWSLATLGIGFEKLALLASALSVGIGFGLQAITQNFVSGLILLAERPVKIGDWVRIGEHEGDIRRISVRSTEIQVGDRSTVIVPNSELITKPIRNMTTAGAPGRVQIQFSVPLSTDVVRLRQLLLDLFAGNDKVLEAPAPSVQIDSIAGGQVALSCTAFVAGPRQVGGTRSELLFELLRQLAEQRIQLVTPADIRLVRDDP